MAGEGLGGCQIDEGGGMLLYNLYKPLLCRSNTPLTAMQHAIMLS